MLSPALATDARDTFGWGPERVAVVEGCVDVGRYQRRSPSAALTRELGLRKGECVIGVVARLQPHRRFDLLLEAFARARLLAPGLRLLVVGRGTRAAQVLDEPVRRLGLGEAVIRAGYRGEDYRDVLSLLHALVFLVPGSDGSCRAVLEAMSMQIPVISSRRGILPETVRDGCTGLLIDEAPSRSPRPCATYGETRPAGVPSARPPARRCSTTTPYSVRRSGWKNSTRPSWAAAERAAPAADFARWFRD